jgi:hypothetical protein
VEAENSEIAKEVVVNEVEVKEPQPAMLVQKEEDVKISK